MAEKSRPADLYIRLPDDKKQPKSKLVKIAAKNDITLNKLMISIVEWFLKERKDREFTINPYSPY